MKTEVLSSLAIRRWLNAVAAGAQPETTDVDEYELLALKTWDLLRQGAAFPSATSHAIDPYGSVPDLAYALCRLISARPLNHDDERRAAAEAWRWLASLPWPANECDERESVLGELAFVLASSYRQAENYRAMRLWEEECAALVAAIEPARSYLSAFATERSPTADERVLADPALLLTFCRQQESLRNVDPSQVLTRSATAFRLVSQRMAATGEVEPFSYFAADLAQSAASSAVQFRYREASAWAQAAEHFLDLSPNCRWLLAVSDSFRLVVLAMMGEYHAVLREAPSVVSRLEDMGADRCVMSAVLCQAQALQGFRKHRDAIAVLEKLIANNPNGDALRLGIAYAQLGDLMVETGEVAKAIQYCQVAYPLLRDTHSSFGIPYLQTIVGQLFRIAGRTDDAVRALHEAAANYGDRELDSWAAYSRILSAESLIRADRAPEALEELVIALALLEGSEAEREVWTAVRLVRTAITTTTPRSAQLGHCRESLERIRKAHF